MERLKIAVMPFINLGEPSWDYLALGLREVTLNWFKKNQFFHLITVELSASELNDRVINDYLNRLNTDILITGNLRVDEQINLKIQSVSSKFKTYNWEKELHSEVRQFMDFGTQLIAHLQAAFPNEGKDIPSKKLLPRGAEAFRDYLLGQHYFQRWDRGYVELALEQFNKVTNAEPDFIPAYLGIAKATVFLVSRGYKNADEHYPEVLKLLERMLLIDPSYGELYIYKGIIDFFYLLDWESAYDNIERGLQYFGEASEAYSQLSLFWYGMREYDKAIEAIHIAMEYNPLSVSLLNMKGDVLISAQRYKEAEIIFKEILQLQPQDKVAIENLMYIAALFDNRSRALYYLSLLQKDTGVSAINFPRIGYIYAKFGFEQETDELLHLFLHPSSSNENHQGRLANVYSGLGEYEKSLAALEKYFNSRMGIIFALTDPQFLPIRNWKSYKKLEQQIKLPDISDIADLVTIQTDLKQEVSINPKNLLYAKSLSNYTELVCYNNFRVEKILIRIALRDLLTQLPSDIFFQCHRSYLINTALEYHKSGNSRGYLLESTKYGFQVPISRSKIQEMVLRVND